MKRSNLLLIDSFINLLLGILLLTFPAGVVRFLGVPEARTVFYPSILGAVLIGIAIALTVEHYRKPSGPVGLGLGGAICINLCGGLALAGWLLLGHLAIPLHGQVFLWILVSGLIVISSAELASHLRGHEEV